MGTRQSGPPKGLRFRPTGPLHHRWPAGHLLPAMGMGRPSPARPQGSGPQGGRSRDSGWSQRMCLFVASVFHPGPTVSHSAARSQPIGGCAPAHTPAPALLPARTGWTARRAPVDAGEEAPWASCPFSCVSVRPMSIQSPHLLQCQSPPPPSDARPPLRHIPGWALWSGTDSSGSILSTGPGDGQSVCQAFAGFPWVPMEQRQGLGPEGQLCIWVKQAGPCALGPGYLPPGLGVLWAAPQLSLWWGHVV